MEIKDLITQGKTFLGIEFGSTRIKAVLIDPEHKPVASGAHDWENRLDGQIWTYTLDDIFGGLQDCFRDLLEDVKKQYGVPLTQVGALGVSAMMHGYMPFNAAGDLLVPFRTWRNTITGEAADILSRKFAFNIPQRWSIAHLYQAVLNGEAHVPEIAHFNTLAGFIHWKLTGEKVLGIGDASGMFPIDSATLSYDEGMLDKFDALVADEHLPWRLRDILPGIRMAGEDAGALTEEGAKLLDPTGTFQPGCPVCPPEGDAGTGMTATNSVEKRTGNISAGTSVFSMAVLERPLKDVHTEIDVVTTPDGAQVAMVHCNNCTSDLNAYVSLFREFAQLTGHEVDNDTLYGTLYRHAMTGAADCGGILAYNYVSGEGVTAFDEGRPVLLRKPDAEMNLANFMRTHLYSAVATLKLGNDILREKEQVRVDRFYGHGGFFKIREAGARVMAAAMETPIYLMETAGEGGPWGMAILAAYRMQKGADETLPDYLKTKVFGGSAGEEITPVAEDIEGFRSFIRAYEDTLPVERAAIEHF